MSLSKTFPVSKTLVGGPRDGEAAPIVRCLMPYITTDDIDIASANGCAYECDPFGDWLYSDEQTKNWRKMNYPLRVAYQQYWWKRFCNNLQLEYDHNRRMKKFKGEI